MGKNTRFEGKAHFVPSLIDNYQHDAKKNTTAAAYIEAHCSLIHATCPGRILIL